MTDPVNDFHAYCISRWENAQQSLFPEGVPVHRSWTDLSQATQVLNHFVTMPGINQLLLPDSGQVGLNFVRVAPTGDRCLELIADEHAYILRMDRVAFESFDGDLARSYLRIETSRLQPTGIYPGIEERFPFEVLVESAPGIYANRDRFQEPMASNAGTVNAFPREVTRYFRGAFLLTHKRSPINLARMELRLGLGWHGNVPAHELRAIVAELPG